MQSAVAEHKRRSTMKRSLLQRQRANHPNPDKPHIVYEIRLTGDDTVNGAKRYIGAKANAFVKDNQLWTTHETMLPKEYYTTSGANSGELPYLLKNGAPYEIKVLYAGDDAEDVGNKESDILDAKRQSRYTWSKYINDRVLRGFNRFGKKQKQSTKDKITKSSMNRERIMKESPKTRARRSTAMKRVWREKTPKEIQDIKDRVVTKETRAKMSKSHIGLKQTQATKDKIGLSRHITHLCNKVMAPIISLNLPHDTLNEIKAQIRADLRMKASV